ncbi:Actin- protein 2/3 complex subunit 5 [Phytophthora boehmeriae]|uniref:Actin-related protein 2/3 complex subunit 5 n=1 Tax=Phytophthora boehmeriae TaxID=109152 RepID=A0A8T1WZ60_9STRA|nr:Actin- protein 2/3 complex subunit 5 [Phytophthora boehmeriae]
MAADEAQMAAGVKARAAQVQGLLAQRNNEEAVRAALEDPPLQSKNDAVKDENAQVVMSALLACNKGEMQRTVDSLNSALEDNLMKYLARFLGMSSQSASMLEWHQKLAAKAGSGCIMRAFTERKQV